MPDPFKKKEPALKETSPGYGSAGQESEDRDIDLTLLAESLRLTPWERMLANDDALNFADSLRAAMNHWGQVYFLDIKIPGW